MSLKTTTGNLVLIVVALVMLVGLIALFSSQTTNVQTAAPASPESTSMPIITPPPSPTFNATEIAEENMPVPTLPLTVIPPEAREDAGVTNLHPLLSQDQATLLSWSPNSSVALIRKNIQDYSLTSFIQGTIGDLWIVDVNGNELMKVSETAFSWLWSPDGNSVLFSEPLDLDGGLEGNLRIADLNSGQSQIIAQIELVPPFNMQWLQAGHILLSQGASLYRINSDGTDFSMVTPLQLVPLYAEGTTGGSAFRICSDESKIAYTLPGEDSNELWIANFDGTNAVRVSDWVTDFEWKPDCAQLVFSHIRKYQGTGYESSIMVVDRDGENPQEIVPASQSDEVNSFPQWVSPGNWIVYVRRVPNYSIGWLEYEIWKIAPDGSQATLLVKHAGQIPYLSNDGHWLAFNTYVTRRPDTLNAFVAALILTSEQATFTLYA